MAIVLCILIGFFSVVWVHIMVQHAIMLDEQDPDNDLVRVQISPGEVYGPVTEHYSPEHLARINRSWGG